MFAKQFALIPLLKNVGFPAHIVKKIEDKSATLLRKSISNRSLAVEAPPMPSSGLF
jgi:hypothetical protein